MKQNTKISGQPVICQLFSFLPEEIISQAVIEHKADYQYWDAKKMKDICSIFATDIFNRVACSYSKCASILKETIFNISL